MKRRSQALRKPANIFYECPACKSRNLLRLEIDVLCADCDWMSCEEYVELGGMDNIFTAYRDHFSMSREGEIAGLVADQKRDLFSNDERQDEFCPVEVGA